MLTENNFSVREVTDTGLKKKQRMLSHVAFVFSGIIALYLCLIFALMPGFTPAKVIAIGAVILLACIGWLCRRERFYHASAIGIVIVTLAGGLGASLTNGGLEGYVTPILITAPIAAALFLGARATMISAVCAVMCYVFLFSAHGSSLIRPTPYPVHVTSLAALFMLIAATLICAAGMGYFARTTERKILSLKTTQQKLVETARALHHLAHHDALTGLANREFLQQHLDNLLANAKNNDAQICLIHLDLDKFKEVNDTYGHPVGDGVLRQAAKIMSRHGRKDDLVARIGGDEFVIVRIGSGETLNSQIQAFCEELIDMLSQPILVNGVECRIGASAGFVISDSACCTPDTLVNNADIALYESKRAGRGVARRFTSSMRERIENHRALVNSLERAFDEDRIFCVLQPQLSLETGRLTGLEALARIRERDGTVLTPGAFLETIEDIGLCYELDQRVTQLALDALVDLRARGLDIPRISINASAKSLRSSDFVSSLQHELSERDLTVGDLSVEVLESILIESRDDQAAQTIKQMTALGIRTVIDDFGSGHASMSSLVQLSIDGIKLDRSLTSDLECERSEKIVQAIVNLAHALSLPVIAEGIESIHQHAALKAMGCEAGQGFAICHPLPTDELADWMNRFGQSNVERLQSRLRA